MARQRLRSASEPSGSEELPLKDRLYSTWYRLKYGKLAIDNCVGEVEAIVVQATSPLVLRLAVSFQCGNRQESSVGPGQVLPWKYLIGYSGREN